MEDQGEGKRRRNKIRNPSHLFKVLKFQLELAKGTLQSSLEKIKDTGSILIKKVIRCFYFLP